MIRKVGEPLVLLSVRDDGIHIFKDGKELAIYQLDNYAAVSLIEKILKHMKF